eukprot:7433471-Lingulodinium_polyedra.AAC.1
MKSYLALLLPKLAELVETHANTDTVLEEDLFPEEDQGLSAVLYHVLVNVVKGKAVEMVKQAGPSHGIEAWRLMRKAYRPNVSSRNAAVLS